MAARQAGGLAPPPPAAAVPLVHSLAKPQGDFEAMQRPVKLGTFNVGASAPDAFMSKKSAPGFEKKLINDIRCLTGTCDVVCLQEVNPHWATVAASVLEEVSAPVQAGGSTLD